MVIIPLWRKSEKGASIHLERLVSSPQFWYCLELYVYERGVAVTMSREQLTMSKCAVRELYLTAPCCLLFVTLKMRYAITLCKCCLLFLALLSALILCGFFEKQNAFSYQMLTASLSLTPFSCFRIFHAQ
jgi:hypothetical protein